MRMALPVDLAWPTNFLEPAVPGMPGTKKDILSGFATLFATLSSESLVLQGIRAEGIEPSTQAWEAHVLPLNYARDDFSLFQGNDGQTPLLDWEDYYPEELGFAK